MNKLFGFFVLIGVLFFNSCATTGRNSIGLDDAIINATNSIKENLPHGTKVAVVNFTSPSVHLSEYIIEELTLALAGSRNLVVVDRRELELLRNELNFQLSGEVDDNDISSIGRMLGAQYIITGSIADAGTSYRFRVSAVNVESAAREAPSSVTISKSDRQVNHFLSNLVMTNVNESIDVQNPLVGYWEMRELGIVLNFTNDNKFIEYEIHEENGYTSYDIESIGTYDEKYLYFDDDFDDGVEYSIFGNRLHLHYGGINVDMFTRRGPL